jgi:SAM-dependent methyltransferase
MSAVAKRFIAWLVNHDRCWRALDFLFLRTARIAEVERQRIEFERRTAKLIRDRFASMQVCHGPFQGLIYPFAEAKCSALLPKLLGSYESELQPTFEELCRVEYRTIIDVGCAEGYYAVGLARRLPAAKVYAFDTDARARELCRAMSVANGVSAQIEIGESCRPDDLCRLAVGSGLVVCDCEGYESELFTPDVVLSLAGFAIVVEVHDFYAKNLAADLTARFSRTHDVAAIACLDDEIKVRDCRFEEIAGLDLPTRRFIVAERRPGGMEWLIMTPRTDSSSRTELNP